MKYIKLFENWIDSDDELIGEDNEMANPPMPHDDEWDENWSDSVEDDDETFDDNDDEDYPDDEWDSNWSDS